MWALLLIYVIVLYGVICVYTVGTTLYVEVVEKIELAVYTLSGQLYTQRILEPGTLSKGIYFVKVSQEVWKIVINRL